MRLQRALRAFLVVAIEALSLVMLATAARTESIQAEKLPTATTISQKVNSANNAPEAATELLPAKVSEPLTTDTNATPELDNVQPEAATESLPSEPSTTDTNVTPELDNAQPEATNALVSTEVKILTPIPDTVLDIPATAVTVQFAVGSQVELKVNGVAVDSSLIGRTETDDSTKLVTQTWYGVGFQQGENTITAQATTNGSARLTSIKVQVRGDTKQLKIQTLETRIPADRRSTATVQGELLDAKGNRSNQNAVVTLVASAGTFVGEDAKPDQPGFQVQARKGQFTATLRSGLNAQTVRILAKTTNLEALTQIQFETNLRPSIATGVINLRLGNRGTDYYGSFRDFLPADGKNGTQLDIDSAVFATGKIGDWLFTGAYNSDRSLNEDCNGNDRLFRDVQFCEQNYPVYGDSSTVEALTPSQDSLYLRFERSARIPNADPDFAMWGDYNTQEFARSSQEFTATNRQLHGFKANYNLGNLQVTGFYGNNVEGFQRDAIAPDGTSGYYFLSRRLLVPGSENVFIELEELTRPGTVLQRRQLSRGADYEIDYERGTLLFREPLLRTDVDDDGLVLVRRIITTYQYESQDQGNSNIYGGRVQYNLSRKLNHESWLGATYIQENQGIRDFELYGADAQISLGPKSNLIAEYAHSSNDSEFLGPVSGSAYRIEAQGEIAKNITGRAYLRSADTGFANNATVSFVPGQTRYGAQITGKLSQNTNLRLQYDHEDNEGIAPRVLNTFEDLFESRSEAVPGSRVDNSLTTISAGIQQRIGKADLTVDWIRRQREDRIEPNDLSSTSDQLRSRFTLPIADNLTFIAQNELTFSNEVDAVYPDRTLFGLNWEASPGVNVRLAQQFYTRGQFSGNSITSLDVTGEHKFGPNTIMTGRYSVYTGENGLGSQGAIGLKQGFTIARGLKLDLAYEHVFGDFFGRTGADTVCPTLCHWSKCFFTRIWLRR